MKHRHSLALAAAAALLAVAGPVAADCAAVSRPARSSTSSRRRSGSSKPMTITVVKNEKGYVKLDVAADKTKEKFSMPGHVEGDTAMFAGAQRPVVWTCTCTAEGAICHDSGPGSEGTAEMMPPSGRYTPDVPRLVRTASELRRMYSSRGRTQMRFRDLRVALVLTGLLVAAPLRAGELRSVTERTLDAPRGRLGASDHEGGPSEMAFEGREHRVPGGRASKPRKCGSG